MTVVFLLGRGEYAVRITNAQEIARSVASRTMPGTAHRANGITNLRAHAGGGPSRAPGAGQYDGGSADDVKIVGVEIGHTTLGLEADDASEVLTVDATHCEPAPQGWRGASGGRAADVIAAGSSDLWL